jgi:hypothetical protein
MRVELCEQPKLSQEDHLRIMNVAKDVVGVNNGEFPRATFFNNLIERGLDSVESHIEFAKIIAAASPLGRTMVLYRTKEQGGEISPAIQVAKGRESGIMSQSYVVPHAENSECKYESLSCLGGSATLVLFNENGRVQNFVKLGHEPVIIGPDVIHSILYESELVVLHEAKYPPNLVKFSPTWAIPEDSDRKYEFLESLHFLASGTEILTADEYNLLHR